MFLVVGACADLTEGTGDVDGETGSSSSSASGTGTPTTASDDGPPPVTGGAEVSGDTTNPDPSTSMSMGSDDATSSSTGEGDTTTSTEPRCGPQVLLDDDPVLYWRLGDDDATAFDETAHAQHGTHSNVSLGAAGVASDGDDAIELAGSVDNLVSLAPVGAFPSTEFTIEVWVNSTGDTDGGLVSYAIPQTDNEIYLDDPSSLDLMVAGTGIETEQDIVDGEWHHLAVTWRSSDGRYRFFLDGEPGASGDGLATGATLGGGGTLVVGQDQDTVGGGFDTGQAYLGRLDELVIFDTALPAATIAAHRDAILCE